MRTRGGAPGCTTCCATLGRFLIQVAPEVLSQQALAVVLVAVPPGAVGMDMGVRSPGAATAVGAQAAQKLRGSPQAGPAAIPEHSIPPEPDVAGGEPASCCWTRWWTRRWRRAPWRGPLRVARERFGSMRGRCPRPLRRRAPIHSTQVVDHWPLRPLQGGRTSSLVTISSPL